MAEARHRATAALAAIACAGLAHAACDAPEQHQLDFWLGRWEALDQGKVVAESVIERSAEGCAVVEHYRQADGKRIQRRMTLALQPDGTVRQHSLASSDGGAT